MGLLDDAIKEHLDLKRRHGADPVEVERAEREALGPVRRAPSAQEAEASGDASPGEGFAYDQQDEAGWRSEPSEGDVELAGHRSPGAQELDAERDDDEFLEPEPERKRPSRLARIFGRSEPESEADEPRYQAAARSNPSLEELALDEPGRDESDPDFRAQDADRRPAPTRAPIDPLDDPQAFSAPEAAAPPPASGSSSASGLELDAGDKTAQYDVERAPEPGSETAAADEDVLEETPEFLQDTPDHDRLWFEQRPPRDFDFDG